MTLIRFFSAAILFALTQSLTAAPVEQAVFLPASLAGSNFGISVAVSGDTAVVGDPRRENSSLSGVAYVYVRTGGTWAQQAVLTAPPPVGGDHFGGSVAISGDTIVVGASAPGGAAYIFARTGTTWTLQASLKASNGASYFGTSVTISGNWVAVGAAHPRWLLSFSALGTGAGDGSNATGIDGDENNGGAAGSGAVFIFEREGKRWHQQAYVKASNTEAYDNFGTSVALSGDTLVVGASGEDSNATGVNGNQANNSMPQSGAAYVFTRTNRVWTQQAYLKGDVYDFQGFGTSVAIAGDTIAVGAFGELSLNPGNCVYVFTRNPSGIWSQQAALAPTVANLGFGQSVSLWGDTLVVGEVVGGAQGTGAAHVFIRDNLGLWTRRNVILPISNVGFGGGFGCSVAVDGDTIIGGSGPDDYNTEGERKAWIFAGVGTHDIAVEAPGGLALPSTGTAQTVGVLPGQAAEVVYTIRNTGAFPLTLTGTPNRVTLSGSADFSISVPPAAGTLGLYGSTTFTVRFAPSSTGLKTATLSIPSDDPDEPLYIINLSGRGLSTTTDTDGDGMSDAAEYNLASLGFDWQASQTAQVSTYFANANSAGLYTTSQVQSLNVGTPLLTRNPATGKFTLTIGVKKSANLATTPFADFLFGAPGTATTINGAGKLEFEFPSTDNAAFFRLESQ